MDSEQPVEEINVVEGTTTIQEWLEKGVGLEGATDKFAMFLSDKLGVGEKSQYAIYYLTTVAVLETAENVLNIGSGFTKLDTTGFTLAHIKKIVENIEKKVDVILDTPMKLALDYSQSVVLMMMNHSYENAHETLKKVLDEAMRAFYYSAGKKKKLEMFEDCLTAVQLIIFSKILTESYDKERKCFVPFHLLDDKKKNIIGGEIENWLKKAIEEKSKISVKTFFITDSGKKEKIQNQLDSILRIAYPYISDCMKLTSMKTKLSPKDHSIQIKILPKYIPFGSEDMTEIVIGVLTNADGTSKVMKTKIWRSETEVYSLYGGPQTKSDVLTMTVNVPNDLIVITGDGTMKQGQCLGLYSYDPEHYCYKQVATEEHCVPAERVSRFVYRASNEVWYISHMPGQIIGRMMNSSKSQTLPLTGWMWGDGKGGWGWHSDPSVKIKFGPQSSDEQCGDVEIQWRGDAAGEWPECGGVFTRTNKYYCGKSVFVNNNGCYLHCSGAGTWSVGEKIGETGICSTSAGLCPAQIKTWIYFNGFGYKPAQVTIRCYKHSN